MNYYEHHLGDYLRDTAHLSMLEDGAYRRLLDAYYIKELPIPAALRDAYRLVRAQSKPEREAVQTVLQEFFEETPDGWKHKRCDAEIARFQEKREKAQRSAQARWGAQRPHAGNDANASRQPGADAMRTHSEGNAHHTPDTSHQSPDPNTGGQHTSGFTPTPAGSVCLAVKAAGIASVNPSDPRLLALLERGATVEHFVGAADAAKGKRSPWAYLLGTVEGQIAEAAAMAQGPRATTRPGTRADQRAATTNALTGRDRKDSHEQQPAIDVPARVLP